MAFHLFRTGDWISQRKTYKLLDGGRGDSQQPHHHFHYENRLTCLHQNLLVRGCYYNRTTFLLDIPQTQTARRMTPSFTRFFAGHYPKTDDKRSRVRLERPFTKFISIMKKVGQPHLANQPSLYYLRPPRWPPWNLPPTEPLLLNEPALTRVLLLIL